ncbi:MAG: hypothetical protein E6R14_09905, partial [Thermomicrobiales bacterium]
MTDKIRIIDALGEPKLLLPALVNEALAANDRAKYFFTLLQMGQARADDPLHSAPDLAVERLATGIEDDELDSVVAQCARAEAGNYRMPHAASVTSRLRGELATMLEPLRAAGDAAAPEFVARLDALQQAPWYIDDDLISGPQIEHLVSGNRQGGDSAHLLVMDLHKALNSLQSRIASEDIDGAAAYE